MVGWLPIGGMGAFTGLYLVALLKLRVVSSDKLRREFITSYCNGTMYDLGGGAVNESSQEVRIVAGVSLNAARSRRRRLDLCERIDHATKVGWQA